MHWILQKFETFASRIACIEGVESVSYADLILRIEDARRSVNAAGLEQTALIAVQTPSLIDSIAALLALTLEKKVTLPLPPHLSTQEQRQQLETTLCKTILQADTAHSFTIKKKARPSESTLPPLIAEFTQNQRASGLILFSSGTSGLPKAMLHNLDTLLNRYRDLNPRIDRSLLLLLIDHIGGLDSALRTLFSGSTLIVPEARNPEAVGQAIAGHRATILPASPTFLNLMLLADIPTKHDCDSLEIIAYGAEPMPAPLLNRLAVAFPKADLQQKFGTSETGAIRIKSSGRDSLFFKLADRDTQTRIVDGELWLKSPSRIIGYLNADESSLEADGWYRTGDLVEEGPDGSIRIIGRESALINVGGQKVHPSEIETIIGTLAGVVGCQVSAEADPITGSRIICSIVPEPNGITDPLAWKRRIRAHCRGRLASWKVPSKVKIISQISFNQRLKAESST